MAMSQPAKYWTADDLVDLPDDGNRYEVIDGELFVTPTPSGRHQDVVSELILLLKPYARAVGLHLRGSPTAVKFSRRREVQPDLIVLPLMPDGGIPPEFTDVGHLVLAIEVLSPSTASLDKVQKRELYQAQGVDEYWIVDATARTVERWQPDSVVADVLRDTMTWQPVSGRDALEMDLVDLFRRAAGD